MIGRITALLPRSLFFWVLLAAVTGCIGALLFGNQDWVSGTASHWFYDTINIVRRTFLAMLRMIIAPVIFFSLIAGILALGDAARLRTLGATTVVYYLITTTIAIAIGLLVVTVIHPWEQWPPGTIPLPAEGAIASERLIDPAAASISQLLAAIFDQAFRNPFQALAELNILAIVMNAVLIGIALLFTTSASSITRTAVAEITAVFYKILGWFVLLMPLGVFAIVFHLTLSINGTAGNTLVQQLLSFCLVVLLATAVHGLIVLPAIEWLSGGLSPARFIRKVAEPVLVALSSSSSMATLPISLRTAQTELKVDRSVASFVLPLGATMNMDGTALFEGIAAVFLAYLFGIELSLVGTVAIFVMAMLSSIGAPGMPSGSMAGMQMVLLAVGIPLEAIALLLVVERPLDTFRTAVNVEGDLVGAGVVQRRMDRAND